MLANRGHFRNCRHRRPRRHHLAEGSCRSRHRNACRGACWVHTGVHAGVYAGVHAWVHAGVHAEVHAGVHAKATPVAAESGHSGPPPPPPPLPSPPPPLPPAASPFAASTATAVPCFFGDFGQHDFGQPSMPDSMCGSKCQIRSRLAVADQGRRSSRGNFGCKYLTRIIQRTCWT